MIKTTIFLLLFSTTTLAQNLRTASSTAMSPEFEYQVEKEQILYRKLDSPSTLESLKDSQKVKSILIFKDKLYALQTTGFLWTWKASGSNGYWVQLMSSVKDMYTDDNELFVLGPGGRLFRYDGSHYNIRVVPLVVKPVYEAHRVFTKTDFFNVVSLSSKESRIFMHFKDQRVMELPPALSQK